MKKALFSLLVSFCVTAFAQPAIESSPPVIAERGAHHRRWESVEWEPTVMGKPTALTKSYTEMETGMHAWRGGQWVEASADIQLTADGAAATNAAHQVFFAANVNASPAVLVVTPEGKQLRSRILGLSYFDGAQAALIAETKDSIGLLTGADRVLYTNAFDDVDATVEYVVTKAGLSQNIILNGQLPSPAEFNLNPETARLQVLTEFYDPPEPGKATDLRGGLPDMYLDFGQMKIPDNGRAFSVGEDGETGMPVRVFKKWTVMEGRTFLVEEVPFNAVDAQIRSLSQKPRTASLSPSRQGKGENVIAALKNVLPKRTAGRTTTGRMRLAELDRPLTPSLALNSQPSTISAPKAFVLDYTITLSSATNFTFKGDTTHYVSGTVNLSGTTIFEGSTVVKYAVSTSATIIASNTVWQTGSYLPAIFTSKDDNSVGEDISGSSGNPTTSFAGNVALDLTAHLNPAVSNARFCYLSNAISGTNITVQNAQFVQCYSVFGAASATFNLRNVLGYKLGTLQKQTCGSCTAATFKAENVTLHYVTNFISAITNATISLTNCLFAQVTNLQPATITTNSSYILASDVGIFQTVSGGNHYLTDGSPYRNVGTTNINTNLLAALKTRTTYAPIAFTNSPYTNVSTLGPQAQRDTDIPDIGYHYDGLDYIFGGCDVNVDLTFTPGTAVGWFRYNSGWNHAGHGIHIADNKTLNFDGRVQSPCWWAHQTVAQEQLIGYSSYSAGTGGITGWPVSATNSPILKLRFTRCSGLSIYRCYFRDDYGVLTVRATDCEFYVGSAGGYVSTYALTNCFFDRTLFWLDGGTLDQSITLRDCTFRGGYLSINRWSGADHQTPVSIRDCAFDGSIVATADAHYTNSVITDYDYNALQSTNRTQPNGAHDVLITNFNWQASWLGNFYLPTNSTLINVGSRYATNAALYHFTTTTNQVKEAASIVDIGYHYVATDGNGNPLDTDGDGVPDYWEDANGNGNGNDDATSWQSYNSPNGLVGGSGLQVFTPLK